MLETIAERAGELEQRLDGAGFSAFMSDLAAVDAAVARLMLDIDPVVSRIERLLAETFGPNWETDGGRRSTSAEGRSRGRRVHG